jgi:phospholipase C
MADHIEHVVVLMLENSSFDRMLGAVPGVDGIDLVNLRENPDYPSGQPVPARTTAARVMSPDPEHDLDDVLDQIHGPCLGFVRDFAQHYPQTELEQRSEIMAWYPLGTLPVLHTLAQSFAVCDRWFSSMPGPTWPNRFFVHSGTSLGHVDMPDGVFHPNLHLYDQPTVYERLSEKNIDWAIYYGDFPQSLVMTKQWSHLDRYHRMAKFFEQAEKGEQGFPQYAFIEPTYFGAEQNDQHPPSDIFAGEAIIAQVYNALSKSSDLWQKMLLVILYDEHGGFYDHVEPPFGATPPDGNAKEFSFDRYGVRVPAILISPWIDHQVIHDVFDHTSLLKYVTGKWGLGPLGERVPAANSFGEYLAKRDTVRLDSPELLVPQFGPSLQQPALNANQNALIAFSRFLETKIADAAGNTDAVLREIGQRLVASMKEAGHHSEIALERLESFLKLHA